MYGTALNCDGADLQRNQNTARAPANVEVRTSSHRASRASARLPALHFFSPHREQLFDHQPLTSTSTMPPGRTLGASVGLSKHDHGRKSQSTLSKHRQDQLSAFLHTILFTQRYFIPLAVLTFLFDAALTNLIICKVPYTEIDWATYLQQAKLFLKGQRNYAEIRGDTGPCVYPAGHLYTYSLLHWTTAGGTNLKLAQYIFAAIYLIGQGAIIEVYRKAGLPSVLLALLPLSKRLHSIYVLRLFNDGVAMTGMWIALALVAHRRLSLAAVMTSLALSVKMNILLFLPGLAVVLYRYKGFWQAAVDGALILAVQVSFAIFKSRCKIIVAHVLCPHSDSPRRTLPSVSSPLGLSCTSFRPFTPILVQMDGKFSICSRRSFP